MRVRREREELSCPTQSMEAGWKAQKERGLPHPTSCLHPGYDFLRSSMILAK